MKKRKDGLYVTRVWYEKDGERKFKDFYGRTQADVKQKVRAFDTEKSEGRFFKDIAEEWKEEHYKTITYGTQKCYEGGLRRSLQFFGEYRPSKITPLMIDRAINNLVKQELSHKTIAHFKIVLNMIMRKAVMDGDIQYNPVGDIRLPRNLPRTRREMPSEKDIEIIKANVGAPFGLFPYLLIYTGLRRGEALALRYEDIDRKNKLIHVNKAVSFVRNKPEIKEPKTAAGRRTVILLDRLDEKIPCGNGYVFCNQDGSLLSEHNICDSWAKYCALTGLSCTMHQLRHAYASLLYDAGVPDKDAQELLGHTDIALTRNIYTHISQTRKSRIADMLNEKDYQL